MEGDIDINAPWKTHGIHINYKILHDPYPEEENEDNFLTMEEVYAIIAGDKLMSLKDAKNSPDWPEWEIAMQAKLDLLKKRELGNLLKNHLMQSLLQINGYSSRIMTRKEKLSGTEQDSWPKDARNALDTVIWRHFHQLSKWTLYTQF